MGLSPGPATYRRQPIDSSLSCIDVSLSLSLSLKAMKKLSSSEDFFFKPFPPHLTSLFWFYLFFFRAILGSEQNWGEDTEISHIYLYTCIYYPYQGNTFVTTNEPTLIHHNYPESIVYINIHSWCCAFSGFGKMYPSLWCHIQYIDWPKNLCSAYPSLLHTQPLAATDLFTVFIILPFLECYVFGIIQYVTFGYSLFFT